MLSMQLTHPLKMFDGSCCASCRRSVEISLVIRQSMEAAILTNLMPRTQVTFLFIVFFLTHRNSRAVFK